MTGLSKERLESFRALPQALRAELLAQIERDVTGISRLRLQRIVQILNRHLFGCDVAHKIREDLKISRQQFYADLRAGVHHLTLLVDRNQDRSTRVVIGNPREAIISQARAAYQASMSQRAVEMLERLHSAPLGPGEAAEAAGLELEVREDLTMPFASLHGAVELVDAARARADGGDTSEDDRAILEGTFHWVQTHLSCHGTNRTRFLREYDAMVSLLRPRAFAGNRDAALAFCRFSLAALTMLDDFNLYLDGRRAERALSDVDTLLRLRDDLPASLYATLHARRAAFLNGKVPLARRFREERAFAYNMGIQRSSMPSVWLALSMEVSDSLTLGETSHALACASALYGSALASESVEWRASARMILAHAYNAVGRFTEARQLVPMNEVLAQPCNGHFVLPACETLLGFGRYSECFDLATRLVDAVKGVQRLCALILRAKAAYYGANAKGAVADIRNVIAMLDSMHGHSFYAICSAYRTAHLITKEKRYLDMLSAVETILEEDAPVTPLLGETRGLTTRQQMIAQLAVTGEANNDIARQLNISPRTVKNSFNAIYARLGIRARWQLADALERTIVPKS